MLFKKALQHPILSIGILFMIIFIFFLRDNGFFKSHYDSLTPTSCKSAIVMLKKRMPKNWKVKCEKNYLSVLIHSPLVQKNYIEQKLFRAAVYRELANGLMFISRNSLHESLERVFWISIHFKTKDMEIAARTKGEHLAQFRNMKDQKIIAEHLQATVEVKEKIK